jgi:hypothetical protein
MQKTPRELLAGRNLFDLIKWKYGESDSQGANVIANAERPVSEKSKQFAKSSNPAARQADPAMLRDERHSFQLMQDRPGERRPPGRQGQQEPQRPRWEYGQPLPETHPDDDSRRANGGINRNLPPLRAEIQVRRGTRMRNRRGQIIPPTKSDRHSDYYGGSNRRYGGDYPDHLNCVTQVNPDGSEYEFPCLTEYIS